MQKFIINIQKFINLNNIEELTLEHLKALKEGIFLHFNTLVILVLEIKDMIEVINQKVINNSKNQLQKYLKNMHRLLIALNKTFLD